MNGRHQVGGSGSVEREDDAMRSLRRGGRCDPGHSLSPPVMIVLETSVQAKSDNEPKAMNAITKNPRLLTRLPPGSSKCHDHEPMTLVDFRVDCPFVVFFCGSALKCSEAADPYRFERDPLDVHASLLPVPSTKDVQNDIMRNGFW